MEPQPTHRDPSIEKPEQAEMEAEKDFFLQDLVDQTNRFPTNKLELTLQIGGFLVSGVLIAGDEYYSLCADLISNPGTSIHEHITSFGKHYEEEREADAKVPRTTTFIHLRDCSFFGPGNLDKLNIVWRGRISQVDGFFFGALELPANRKVLSSSAQ